jgi:O-succinylbenzoate synthase
VRIDAVELVRVRMPLVRPFRAAHGTTDARDVLLVRVLADGVEGWGEDVAQPDPGYAAEYVDVSHRAARDHLVPRLLAAPDVTAAGVGALLAPVRGWSMAKAAIETAVLDAELRQAGIPLHVALGGVRTAIPAGVAVGLHDDVGSTLDEVRAHLDAGYVRVKCKIAPGRDLAVVAAVRGLVGPDYPLQVDANSAYTLDDADHLARLDEHGLLLVEQPLAEDDLRRHALLARRLRTPVCLDESLTSARITEDALELGACSIVNLKAGRVGGVHESLRIHDLCVARGVPIWVGGMLETGVGRALNLALASLPGCTLPPDLSASDRYYREDLTEPFVLRDGHIDVPRGPGLGVTPDPERLRRAGATVERLTADG